MLSEICTYIKQHRNKLFDWITGYSRSTREQIEPTVTSGRSLLAVRYFVELMPYGNPLILHVRVAHSKSQNYQIIVLS